MPNNVFVDAANETLDKYVTKTLEGNRSKIITLIDNWVSRKILLIAGSVVGVNASQTHDAVHMMVEGAVGLVLVLIPVILSYKNDKINKLMKNAAVNVAQQVNSPIPELNPLGQTLVNAVANANVQPNASF